MARKRSWKKRKKTKKKKKGRRRIIRISYRTRRGCWIGTEDRSGKKKLIMQIFFFLLYQPNTRGVFSLFLFFANFSALDQRRVKKKNHFFFFKLHNRDRRVKTTQKWKTIIIIILCIFIIYSDRLRESHNKN